MWYRTSPRDDNAAIGSIPSRIYQMAKQVYYRIFRVLLYFRCTCSDSIGTVFRSHDVPVPPSLLRYKVSESTDTKLFLDVGERTAATIERTLNDAGTPLNKMKKVLDFGCGCGRTLRWLVDKFPHTQFFGTDVDVMSVKWCQKHLNANVCVNGNHPPLCFSDSLLDCVYAISVFTHLSEQYQLGWLAELRRVLRPGGLLLVSLHGMGSLKCLAAGERDMLRTQGFLFMQSSKLCGIHPAWYQTAFHTEEYVVRTWSKYFRVIEYKELGLGYQDVVVLRRE